LAVGNELGPRRVGAIGGIAADELANPGRRSLGLVGTGTQAWNQLWAIGTVRDLADVRVFSRDIGRRAEFAARAHAELGLPARAVDTLGRGADQDVGRIVRIDLRYRVGHSDISPFDQPPPCLRARPSRTPQPGRSRVTASVRKPVRYSAW
jgi:Ornithine cyclodeaminase/mu-crystallin family